MEARKVTGMSKVTDIFDRELFFVDHDGEYVLNLYFNHDSGCGGTLVYRYYNFDAIRNAFRESHGDYDAFVKLIDGKCYEENLDVGDDPERIVEAVRELCKPTPYVGRSKETIFALMEEIGFAFRKGEWVERDIGDGMEPLAKCSLCGYTEKVFCKGLVSNWHYCPNCGASMDKGEL